MENEVTDQNQIIEAQSQLVSVTPAAQPVNDWRARQEAARQACIQSGIEWPATRVPEGSALIDTGSNRLRSDRARWQQLPTIQQIIGDIKTVLQTQDRRDLPFEVKNLRLRAADSRMVKAENIDSSPAEVPGLAYSPHSFGQFVNQIEKLDDSPRGMTSALLWLKAEERAAIVNARLIEQKAEATPVTLRTRLTSDGGPTGNLRFNRATLSGKYGSITDLDIARAIEECLPAGARLDYRPGDDASRLEIVFPSEIPVETFVVGDVHYATLSIGNGETGMRSNTITPAVVRAACYNLTTSEGKGLDIVIRHIGDSEVLLGRLKAAIKSAVDMITPLLMVVTKSAKVYASQDTNPEKIFNQIAKRAALPAATAKTWSDMFASEYKSMGQVSAWSLANAMTEAAHKSPTWLDSEAVETVASKFQKACVDQAAKGVSDPIAKAAASF